MIDICNRAAESHTGRCLHQLIQREGQNKITKSGVSGKVCSKCGFQHSRYRCPTWESVSTVQKIKLFILPVLQQKFEFYIKVEDTEAEEFFIGFINNSVEDSRFMVCKCIYL